MRRALILYSTEEIPVLKEIDNLRALPKGKRPLAKLFTCAKDFVQEFETGLLSCSVSRT